jgi:hypothetical protein
MAAAAFLALAIAAISVRDRTAPPAKLMDAGEVSAPFTAPTP